MEHKFTFISDVPSSTTSSSCTSHALMTKSDIVAFAIGNPANKSHVKLSARNRNYLGMDTADSFTKRHNHELQRCSQFYSLSSIYNETSTKDKHRLKTKDIKRIYLNGKKYFLRLFICFVR